MENTASFDLTRAIQQWREQLGQAPALRRENLDELESHLGDSIAALQSHGLSARESFMVATQRLGREDALQAEFGKVNSGKVWLDRMLWMLIGIQAWGLVSGLVGSISSGAVSLGLIGGNFDFVASPGSRLPVFLFVLAHLLGVFGSLAICWWLIVRKGPALASRIGPFFKGRVKFAVTCGTLCLVWAVAFALSLNSTLLFRLAGPETFGSLMVSRTYANLFGWPLQTVMLLALTLILARRRLRANEA